MELDLLYIETMSFWGDVKIIAKLSPRSSQVEAHTNRRQ